MVGRGGERYRGLGEMDDNVKPLLGMGRGRGGWAGEGGDLSCVLGLNCTSCIYGYRLKVGGVSMPGFFLHVGFLTKPCGYRIKERSSILGPCQINLISQWT